MSTIINGFTNQPNVIVEWWHSSMPNCYQIPPSGNPGPEPDPEPPKIGGNAGHFILKAIDKDAVGGPAPIKSSITLHPFFRYGHNVILSYDITKHEWKIMATARQGGLIKTIFQNKQIDVNVEIGP
jgi:hypothetical protein